MSGQQLDLPDGQILVDGVPHWSPFRWCRHPECRDTNWQGRGRVHLRSHRDDTDGPACPPDQEGAYLDVRPEDTPRRSRQQAEAARAFDWTWLPAVIAKLGEPRIQPPTPGATLNPGARRLRVAHQLGVPLEGKYRRAWVWFVPDSTGRLRNTGLHIDTRPEGHTTLEAWRHSNADAAYRRCELTQDGPLTDEQVRGALAFAWQELAP